MTARPTFANGWHVAARRVDSPNFDDRPDDAHLELVVLHHISLPAGSFGGDAVERLFTNRITSDDPTLAELAQLRVSAHFFIRRDGELVQFVNIGRRAWHAGVSAWRGRDRCNDFSVGIELEGDSEQPFEPTQYAKLSQLLADLRVNFPNVFITTHEEIAFGRKVDPGPKFDFALIKSAFQ